MIAICNEPISISSGRLLYDLCRIMTRFASTRSSEMMKSGLSAAKKSLYCHSSIFSIAVAVHIQMSFLLPKYHFFYLSQFYCQRHSPSRKSKCVYQASHINLLVTDSEGGFPVCDEQHRAVCQFLYIFQYIMFCFLIKRTRTFIKQKDRMFCINGSCNSKSLHLSF